VTLPLIVRGLGTESYGIWAQVLALIALLGSAAGANLHIPLVRFVSEDRRVRSEVYPTLLVATVGAGAAMVLLVVAAAEPIGELIVGEQDIAALLRISAVLLVLNNVRVLNSNFYRATGRIHLRSIVELVNGVVETAGIVLAILLGGGLWDVFAFMVGWQSALVLVQTVHVVRLSGWGGARWNRLKESLAYALPLLPAILSLWILDRVDRFVIGNVLGAKAVGIYAAAYALAGVVMLFQSPFQMTLLPKVAELWGSNRALAMRYVSTSQKVFLSLAIPFAAALPLVAEPLLELLGNREIALGAGVTTTVIAVGIVLWGMGIMQIQILHGAKRPGAVGTVTAISAALNFVLNLVLVPMWGVLGAAVATLVAYLGTFLALGWLCRAEGQFDYDVAFLARSFGAALVMDAFLAMIAPKTVPALALAIVGGGFVYFVALWCTQLLRPVDERVTWKGLVQLVRGR